jgi:hypothetical protein
MGGFTPLAFPKTKKNFLKKKEPALKIKRKSSEKRPFRDSVTEALPGGPIGWDE